MKKTIALAGLALAAVTLGGCGGGTSDAPATAAPAAPAASSSSAAAPASSAAASPSSSATTAATAADACDVLDADDVEDLTGVAVKKGTTQAVGGTSVCTWLPTNGTKSDAAVFSAQEGPLKGSLSAVASQLKTQFDGKSSKLDVPGADDALYITGKKSGLNVIDVVAQKDEVFYQVLAASPRDAEQHKPGALKIVQKLLAG